MQTFLPYPDFAASAAVLDSPRLGKQRVEALQVVRALTREGYGWQRHPAVRMWRGYPEAVAAYGLAVVAEWVSRGHADTCDSTIRADLAAAGLPPPSTQERLALAGKLPPWLGDERVHSSHRRVLLAKAPEHYGPLFPHEAMQAREAREAAERANATADPPTYFWPVA